ncbi:hypothetical protein AB5I41_19850 [Sphingomonas sp. MMS24-JH45]
MKCHHPDALCAALLNAQPMGFYAPAQIVRDARAHGWRCGRSASWRASGIRRWRPRMVGRSIRCGSACASSGLSGEDGGRILTARAARPFASVEDLWRRSGVPLATLEKLARADAFAAMGHDRRQALWAIRGLGEAPLPLLAGIERREEPVTLARLTEGREVVEDYRATQMSLRAHPLVFLRPELADRRMVRCEELAQMDGKRVEVAGIILVRQRPGWRRACCSSPSRTRRASPTASCGPTGSRRSAAPSCPPRWSA